MLVLSRKVGERIVIGSGANAIIVTVLEVVGGKVRVGIEADRSIPVIRAELLDNADDGRPEPNK